MGSAFLGLFTVVSFDELHHVETSGIEPPPLRASHPTALTTELSSLNREWRGTCTPERSPRN